MAAPGWLHPLCGGLEPDPQAPPLGPHDAGEASVGPLGPVLGLGFRNCLPDHRVLSPAGLFSPNCQGNPRTPLLHELPRGGRCWVQPLLRRGTALLRRSLPEGVRAAVSLISLLELLAPWHSSVQPHAAP